MLINGQSWNSCDCCGKRKPAEYGHVAQGGTGRWCVVLSACSDCVNPDDEIMTPEAAREWCDSQPNSWAEF